MRMILIFISLVIFSCNIEKLDNPVAPLPLDHNPITMKIGDSWLFQHLFINISISEIMGFPDTIIGYSYFSAVKDTTIDDKFFLIIDGRDYDVEKDSISIYKKRFAIHLGDTVLMYKFNTGNWGFMSDLMKQKVAIHALSKLNYGPSILKKILLNKLLVSSGYDTSVYYDFVYPLVFPLLKDSAYVFRDTGDPCGNIYYRKRYVGTDNISTPIGQFQAYKVEYLASEAIGIDSIFYYDWIGLNGLLKRYVDGGNSEIQDSLGNTIGRVRNYNITELIGRNDINPDTLKPWGKL